MANDLTSLKVARIINRFTTDPNIENLYVISETKKFGKRDVENTVASLCRDTNTGLFFKITDKYKNTYTEDDLEEVMLNYLNNRKMKNK